MVQGIIGRLVVGYIRLVLYPGPPFYWLTDVHNDESAVRSLEWLALAELPIFYSLSSSAGENQASSA